jgi:histidinol phosphatase-like enzyme (inositol monophosphatase family)
MEDFEVILHKLADAAEEAIASHCRGFQRATRTLSNKHTAGGFDPVTAADKAAELAIRTCLSQLRPDDAILGEEFGETAGRSGVRWIVDPIDGTRAFMSGLPTWGTIIGTVVDAKPIAGMFCQALTGERFWAHGGHAQYAGLRNQDARALQLATSAVRALDEATLMTTSPRLFSEPALKRYDAVERHVRLARYGADGYAYCLLAAGQIDLVIEDDLHPYDIAGLIPIIEAAGGIVTDWSGQTNAPLGGSILAAANHDIHSAALAVLNS